MNLCTINIVIYFQKLFIVMLVKDLDQGRFVTSILFVFVGFLVWSAVTLLGGILSNIFSRSYRNLCEGQQREWRGRITAFIHSVVACISASYILYTFPYTSELCMFN